MTAATIIDSPRRKILVADESAVTDSAKLILQRRQHAVFTANTGGAALELALREIPDVVITDPDLNGCDGLDLVRCLRGKTQFAQTVLFAVSGNTDICSMNRAKESGFDYYAGKPVDPDALVHGAEASRPDCLVLLSRSLIERSRELHARCGKLSELSRRVTQQNVALLHNFTTACFLTPPQRLALEVSKYAAKAGGYKRICFVVVNASNGTLEQIDAHFTKQADARQHARRFGANGYYYPLYERKHPKREIFPSAAQILSYLNRGTFEP